MEEDTMEDTDFLILNLLETISPSLAEQNWHQFSCLSRSVSIYFIRRPCYSCLQLCSVRCWKMKPRSFRVHSHAPSIRSPRGKKVVFPDFLPMRISEEPVCINIFRQNPVFTSLHLRSPVYVVPPPNSPGNLQKMSGCERGEKFTPKNRSGSGKKKEQGLLA